MTLTNRTYYDELVGSLSQKHQVNHFILWASRETLLKRLASRLEGPSSWGAQQIDRCLHAFETDITERKILTDQLTISEAAEQAAALSGLPLSPDRRSPARRLADRLITQIKYIR